MLFIYKILMPKNLKSKARESFNEFYKNMPKISSIIILFCLTIIFWLMVYSQAYITALAFNLKINFLYFLFIFPIAIIISLIPISISGFGTRESALIVLFAGFDKIRIVSFSIAWAFISLVYYSIIFMIIIIRKQKEASKKLINKTGVANH